jgi:hypothetical protein
VLVAGEETNESLSTWPRAAAAQQSSESERERRTRREEGMQRTDGGNAGYASTAGKNTRASCGPFFQFL